MTKNSRQNFAELSVIIDSRIYGYLFAPIIAALEAKGIHIYIYTPRRILDHVRNDIGLYKHVEFLDLDPIRKRNRWRWLLHRIAMDLFVRDDFSYQLHNQKNEITKKLPPMRRVLVKLSRLLPKVPNNSINAFLERLVGIGFRNPFQTRTIITGSLNASAELLCAKDQIIITVMESWDHAVKHPNGYTSELVFTWNNDLKRDWQRVHNDQNVYAFYPLKLRYARDVVSEWPKHEREIGRPFFVYSVSSTRRFSMNILVDLERRLIRDMARAAEMAGWDLFIKPRPNGEDGEFSDLIKEFSCIRIGSIVDQDVSQAADYYLNDEYNIKRFSEINEAKFVINAFTTFGLDSAAAGIPVLQIDIRKAEGYSESSLIYENYHLKNYLLQRDAVLRIQGDLVSHLSRFLKAPNNFPEEYSAELKTWLFSDRSQSDAINELIEKSIEQGSSC